VRAGTSKSGLHNKPAGCGAAEAYVPALVVKKKKRNPSIHEVRLFSTPDDYRNSKFTVYLYLVPSTSCRGSTFLVNVSVNAPTFNSAKTQKCHCPLINGS
jgi:hypothetical protein